MVTYLENDTYSEIEKAQVKLSKLGLNAEQISQVTEQLENGGRESAVEATESTTRSETITNSFDNIKK